MLGRLNWWILVLRGIVGILFGILAFAYPRDTVAALVILLGAYLLVDSVTALVVASMSIVGVAGWCSRVAPASRRAF